MFLRNFSFKKANQAEFINSSKSPDLCPPKRVDHASNVPKAKKHIKK